MIGCGVDSLLHCIDDVLSDDRNNLAFAFGSFGVVLTVVVNNLGNSCLEACCSVHFDLAGIDHVVV